MSAWNETASAPAQIDDAIAGGVIPGAVLAAGIGGDRPAIAYVAGDAQRDPAGQRAMSADTIFDLASLTKVVATTPCILRLIAAGEVRLDDHVLRYLPGFDGPGKDRVTVRQLLAHTSGLPDYRPYHESVHDPVSARAAALAEPLICAPGSTVCYSDIGFIVAGELCAAVAGCGLGQIASELVFEPLRMNDTGYLPAAALAANVAATEHVGDVAKTGVVHDQNAEALGGVAGHAGLFGPVRDLVRYAAAWAVEESELAAALQIPAGLKAEALRCQTDGLTGRRGLGWGLRHDPWDNMGEGWPASGAGHTGFTGTCLSIDPASGMWMVLLTNAVHFGRGPDHSVVGLRKRVHAMIAATLLDHVVQ